MEGKKLVKQQSKDPFEAAFDEEDNDYDESPPPAAAPNPTALSSAAATIEYDDDYDEDPNHKPNPSSASDLPLPAETMSFQPPRADHVAASGSAKPREDDDEEEEENMDVELDKLASTGDPDKSAKMQAILSQFTEEQMSRYESFRRAGFQRANMKRLLASITGTQKISIPMTIVVSGIAKMFVGELVETARMVMTERKESGPIRPCHIREAYRRLKIEGKVPKRSVPRLFR